MAEDAVLSADFPNFSSPVPGIRREILWILSFARQTYHINREKELFDMKATGIVRRIDDYVIIGYKVGKP